MVNFHEYNCEILTAQLAVAGRLNFNCTISSSRLNLLSNLLMKMLSRLYDLYKIPLLIILTLCL